MKLYRVVKVSVLGMLIALMSHSMCVAQINNEGNSSIGNSDYTAVVSPTISGEISRHWVQDKDTRWRYVDEFEVSAYGAFYDEYGDIYYGGDDGYILQNTNDRYGQYYGLDGRLVNKGASLIGNAEAEGYAKALTTGGIIDLGTKIETGEFLEFYFGQRYIAKQSTVINLRRKRVGKNKLTVDKGLEIVLYNDMSYNIEQVNQEIDKMFEGKYVGTGTAKDDLIQIANIIAEDTTYDDAYVSSTMSQVIKDKRGCCWHYARMMNYMLNKVGIHSEVIDGSFINESHSWLRVRVDGKWQYVDISAYVETKDMSLLDIDYSSYINRYKNRDRVIPFNK